MNASDVRSAWARAEERAASAQGRPERTMASVLRDDIPTFMEAPSAICAADLAGADVVFLGLPYEGVKLLDPVTYAPALASPAPEGSILLPQRGRRGSGSHSPLFGLLLATSWQGAAP